MQRFDDSPFGSNGENPFVDPAILQVTSTQKATKSLEDYNPFDDQSQDINPSITVRPNPHESASNSRTSKPEAAVPKIDSAALQITTDELQRRQEELVRKAAELDRREQQLQANLPRLNNWPPLPDNFCVKPCFYQDIQLEISPEFQKLVKHLYYTWMFYTLTMCLNVIGGIILLFHDGNLSTLALGIFYAALFTPASYICWFRPAYKAFRDDSSFNFMIFFFVYSIQVIISIFQAIGIPGAGYCGFFTAISQFDSSIAGTIVGILLFLIACCFITVACANVMMITKIHSIYRSSEASVAKAQAEFATGFMRNQGVQETASSIVNNAVRNQFNSSRY